jgi:hypothetical protein
MGNLNNKVKLYVGLTIALVVAIVGCCFLSAVNGIFVRNRAAAGDGFGLHPFSWTPWGLLGGLIGRLFSLGIAVIVIVAIIFFVLWVTGRISVTWRGNGGPRWR